MGVQETVRRVRQQGDAHRKTVQNSAWLPDGSSPLWDIYWRYCRETGRTVGDKVGRCHFWHVVLVIAPLRQTGKQLSKSVGTSFLSALGALVVLAAAEWLFVSSGIVHHWYTPILFVIGIANIVGIVFGVFTYWALHDDRSLMSVVRGILNDKDKMSWGVALALLAGPGLLLGVTVMYFMHNIWCLLMKLRPVKLVADNIGVVSFWLFVVVGVGAGATAAYLHGIRPYGWMQCLIWAVEGLGILVVVFVVFLTLSFAGAKTHQRIKERRETRTQILIAAGMPLPEPRDNIVKRFFAKVMTALRFVRDVVRLIFEATRYGYKQVCHLSPVPQRIIAAEQEEEAKRAEEVPSM